MKTKITILPSQEFKRSSRGTLRMNTESKNDVVVLASPPCFTEFFHSGNEAEDVACLLNMAIDLVEIWDVKNSPYNQRLKCCWMKRAQEFGAHLSW